MKLDKVILHSLINNSEYTRKVLSFIEEDYFKTTEDKILFDHIKQFVRKYKKVPTYTALEVEIDNRRDLNESEYNELQSNLKLFKKKKPKDDLDWLTNKTEAWCKDRALYNAFMESIAEVDSVTDGEVPHTVVKRIQDAISVNFDTNIGHRFFADAEKRYEFYHKKENKLPFDIDILNKITDGGLTAKTMTMFLGATGGCKSMTLCHLAASYVLQGKNVLYITLEMPEEKLGHRIDANIMNVNYKKVKSATKDSYMNTINKISGKSNGEIVIKEYPAGASHAGHFRFLIKELELKKKFKTDVLIVDYLQICASSRYKAGSINNSYYLKSVAEELRGLGQEFNIPVISAGQVNRDGMGDSDVELDQIAESIGITHTCDLVLAIIRTEEMDNMNQMLFKQLKNRYEDTNYYKRFVVGAEFDKSKLFDLNDSAQDDIINDSENETPKKQKKKSFEGFKV